MSICTESTITLIGTLVTYRYRGLNDSGIPRFASFMRVREDGLN